jgi:ABC-type multidrug transport system fused ATPase/permease subunit
MQNYTRQTAKIYLEHAAKYRGLVFVILAFGSLATIFSMLVPLWYKRFFDILSGVTASADVPQALGATLLIIMGFQVAVRLVFRRIAEITDIEFETRVMADLSNTAFAYLHKHSFSFFNDRFVGSLVKQVNSFSRAFEIIKDKLIWNLLPMAIEIIIATIVLFSRAAWLGWILLAWLGLLLGLNWVMTKYKLQHDIRRNEAETKATGVLADSITNNVNVKLFSGYDRERSFYGQATDIVRQLRKFTNKLNIMFNGVQAFLTTALELGILFVSIRFWRAGILTPGDFVLIQLYLFKLFDRVWDFGRVMRDIFQALADAEDMTTILIAPHDITDAPGAKALSVTRGDIAFTGLTFCYRETREVLSDFNLHIAPHEKVALVGPSGAGKSTIVKLLLRQHDVTSGQIRIDGQPIAQITQESLWRNVSLVPQDPILSHRSLKENIRYGKPGASDDEVVAAAKLAHCHEFISEFSDGYETYVGERGMKLSGGERQRVAIARAILRNAPILVLDEATSSLDSESERLIQDALTTLMKDKTVIVIAHRLSTIMKMDRILVIDGGKIAEKGKHVELLQKPSGLYRRLWELQAGGFLGAGA